MSGLKRLKRIAMVLCLAATGLFASCTKEAGYMDLLLGKWQQTVARNPGTGEEIDLTPYEPFMFTVEFKNDGTFLVTNDFYEESNYSGTFRIRDNQLELLSITMYGETAEGDFGKFLITEVNASFLSLKALTLRNADYPDHYENYLSATTEGNSKYKRLITSPLI